MDDGTAPLERKAVRAELLNLLRESTGFITKPALGFVGSVGEHFMLLSKCAYWAVRPPFRARLYLEAAEFVGIGSLPIIVLVAAFTGMVTALQSVHQLRMFGVEGWSGSATGLALATELGPVLTALMLCGRVGAGIATELGTMRITEQIDALEAMAVSPVQYLVVPRVIIGTIMTPILTMLAFVIGMGGGYFVAVKALGVDQGVFIENFRSSVDPEHLVQGLVKGTVFGLTLSLVGCYQGYNASGGGRGVGLATTRAVVIGSVGILIIDYFLTNILLSVMSGGE